MRRPSGHEAMAALNKGGGGGGHEDDEDYTSSDGVADDTGAGPHVPGTSVTHPLDLAKLSDARLVL